MSSLLEQAIVDATALKEAATKNAEKNFIDKYSHKIKEAVDKLLEQEMNAMESPMTPPAGNMDAASALENVPTDLNQPPANTLDSMPQEPQKKDPLEKIKSSFMSDGEDEELITIDFSSLKVKPVNQSMNPPMDAGMAQPAGMPAAAPAPAGAAPAAPMPAAAPTEAPAPMQEGLRQYEEGEDELMEEEDLEEEQEELDEEVVINLDDSAEVGMPCEGEGCMEEQVEIEIDEDSTYGADEAYPEALEEEQEEIEEEVDLEESLIVDMEGVSDGWRGTQPNERRELENVELARLQDEEIQLKIREYEDAVNSAQKKVKKATKEKEVLMKENMELKSTLLSLKGHIEKMNISNAKLLYINRALGSSSLNERQKQQVVETISKCDSVEGAKIVYETLQSSVQSVVQESKAPKSLNEAVSRSGSPFLVRQRSQEMNPVTERMKILAGIKN